MIEHLAALRPMTRSALPIVGRAPGSSNVYVANGGGIKGVLLGTGIDAASTAVAGLIKKVRNGSFPRIDTVMVNLTGGDRPRTPPAPNVRWLRRDGGRWVEEG